MTQSLPIVMIVDDDVPLRTAFARAIERAGYGVVTTTGSSGLLDLIVEHQPALILLDNHMPGATGIELIKAIRHEWSTEELPVVLISGSSIQGEINEAMKFGANDFRRKPVDLDDLVATVRSTLGSPLPLQPTAERTRS